MIFGIWPKTLLSFPDAELVEPKRHFVLWSDVENVRALTEWKVVKFDQMNVGRRTWWICCVCPTSYWMICQHSVANKMKCLVYFGLQQLQVSGLFISQPSISSSPLTQDEIIRWLEQVNNYLQPTYCCCCHLPVIQVHTGAEGPHRPVLCFM